MTHILGQRRHRSPKSREAPKIQHAAESTEESSRMQNPEKISENRSEAMDSRRFREAKKPQNPMHGSQEATDCISSAKKAQKPTALQENQKVQKITNMYIYIYTYKLIHRSFDKTGSRCTALHCTFWLWKGLWNINIYINEMI